MLIHQRRFLTILNSLRLRCAGTFAVLLLAVALSGVPDAQAANALIFNNITGIPNASGIDSVTASAPPIDTATYRYAQRFVASGSGTARLISLWAQCITGLCGAGTATGTIEIHADSAGVPAAGVLASASFLPPATLGGSPTCVPLSAPGGLPVLSAGTTYWATLSSNGLTAWKFQSENPGGPLESINGGAWHPNTTDKTLSLRVDDAGACGPHALPNPASGTLVADMVAAPGQPAFNTITIGNDGTSNLSINSGSFSGPNASVFSLLQTEPLPPELAQPYVFPTSVPVNVVSILYVVCTGPATEGAYTATLTVATNDPENSSLSWPVRCLVDNTPPTLQFNFTPDGTNGWFKTSPASGSIIALDPESGGLVKNITCPSLGIDVPASAVSPVNIATQGDNTVACTATDVANNVGNGSTHVKLDSVAPVVTGTKTPASNAADWNNSDVTVAFACTDAAPSSGIASTTGGGTFTAETSGTAVPGACKDVAGNTAAPAGVTVKIDKTAPIITPNVSPPPNAAGWNNTNLIVQFACADSGAVQSGIQTDTVSDVPVTTETGPAGTLVASNGICADIAGNSATGTSTLVKLDKTPPTTALTGQPALVEASTNATFTFTGDDGLNGSGVKGFICKLDTAAFSPCVSGIAFSGLAAGNHTFQIRAIDVADNTDATGVSYTWQVVTVGLTIDDVAQAEGNVGTTSFDFTVKLSPASPVNVTVTYTTIDGTAVAPGDYTAIPPTVLTFAPGETSRTVSVLVNGDTTNEPDETFFVNLSSPTGAALADGQGLGTILNDDGFGGKNLKISAPGPDINLTWTGGTAQTDYVVRRDQLLPAGPTTFSRPLPANATSYTDPAPPSSTLLCYQVEARNSGGATIGLSDFDCGRTGFEGGTVIPGDLTLGLNQTSTANLTWTAPAGGPVDGYALYKLPFDGSPTTFEVLGAGATSNLQDMGATHYCYTLVAFRGGAFGNTNFVCGIQGFSTLAQPLGRTAHVPLGEAVDGLKQALGDLRGKFGNLGAELSTQE